MPAWRRLRRGRRKRRVLEDDEDWECPYEKCKLRCSSEWAHRRRLAFLRRKFAAPAEEKEEKDDDDGGEPDVQRYVGVYVDANGEVVPISLADALRAVAEGE